MSRCPYLEYVSRNMFLSSNDSYYCKLSGRELEIRRDELQLKHTCNSEYASNYQYCPVYKERRY